MVDKKTDWKLMFDRALDMLQSQFDYSKDQAFAIIDKAMQILLENKNENDFIIFKDFTDILIRLIRHKCN